MEVVIGGVVVELPEVEAELLLRRGIASLPERTSTDPRTGSGFSGIPTPRGRRPVTGSKPRKQSRGSSKKGIK